MKREDLKKLELSDEVIDKIMTMHGTSVEKAKADLAAAQAEAASLKTQLDEAGATIEGFKKMDPEKIKQEADAWKQKFDDATAAHASELLKIRQDGALERILKDEFKVKDLVAVRAHLKHDQIKFNEKDETFIGLKEQVEPLKEQYGSYFTDGKLPPEITTETHSQNVTNTFEAAARKGAGLPAK